MYGINCGREIKKIFLVLAILLLIPLSLACSQSADRDITGQRAVPATTSGITATQASQQHNLQNADVGGSGQNNNIAASSFRFYVIPGDRAVEALAAEVDSTENAYELAVGWIYVSDEKLNHAADRWLTPHEFLTNTPSYLNNPLQGEEVSDCEEQSNTLVSLIRAKGVRPEDIRVALGEVEFGGLKAGHAWVELFTGGRWLALDPSRGPYWDDQAGKLNQRPGVPFDYYARHTYPTLRVWAYYNDNYCLNPGDGSGNAPGWWYQPAAD